jgi:hypothetical protein
MLNSSVLETGIGLIFVFLGFSLITTSVQEFLASVLKLRAATLRTGLKTMLSDGQAGFDFFNKVFGHPIVAPAGDKPSYISAQQFSAAAISVLTGAGSLPVSVQSLRIAVQNLPDAPYKTVMLGLFREGETDIAQFETRLQVWFDQSMDRVSGTYKRVSQYISLGIGVAIAFVLQVNTIAIAGALWTEPFLRTQIADMAASGANLPASDAFDKSLSLFNFQPVWVHFSGSAESLLGCAITAFAISLGAPFWFDLLQKFVSLRGTGPAAAPSPATPPTR